MRRAWRRNPHVPMRCQQLLLARACKKRLTLVPYLAPNQDKKEKPVRITTLAATVVIGAFALSSFAADAGDESAPGRAAPPGAAGSSTPASQPSASPGGGQAQKESAWLDQAKQPVVEEKKEPPAEKGPPLPFHSIEGYGGGAITPMAYLVNPPKKGDWFGLPSAAFSNVMAGQKNLQAFTVTENILGRIELGYGLNRLGLGTLPGDIEDATGVDIGRSDVWLHNFNVRGLLLEENAFGTKWLPALTAGAHFKINDGINSINNRLGGALSGIGYDRDWGIDYTLTASKTLLDKWTLNRPLIVTGGLRLSEASNLGFLGFGDQYKATFEGSVAYLPTDWLLVAYEYRQKANQYSTIPGLVGKEDDWHAIDVSWIINKHATLVAGWGALGNLVNGNENGAWFLQFKYEF